VAGKKRILKIVEKFLRAKRGSEFSYTEVKAVIEYFGYVLAKEDPPHKVMFKKEKSPPISIARSHESHKKVKWGYVKKICKILNLEEWYECNKE